MRTIATILLLVFFVSCKKDRKCFKSLGERQTVTRTLGNFDEINISDHINVTLEPSTVNEAVIEAGENMIAFIETRIEGNKLIIEDLNKCNFMRSYEKNELNVRIKYTDLRKVFLESSGSLLCSDTLRFNYFMVEGRSSSGDIDLKVKGDTLNLAFHTGTSNLNVSGKTFKTEVYSGGNGIFHLENLNSDVVLCNNSGTGDIYLHANTYLFAFLHLMGDIYYTGNPYVDLVVDGKGKLIQQ